MSVNLLKSISKAIITLFGLIAVIILIFSMWYGFVERPIPFQHYILKSINSNAAPFTVESKSVMLKLSFDKNFININVQQPKVKKDNAEIASLPNLSLKTNPVAILRKQHIDLHLDFDTFNLEDILPNTKNTSVKNVDFTKLFKLLNDNESLAQIFSLNLSNIQISPTSKLDLYGIKVHEITDDYASFGAIIESEHAKLGFEIDTKLDDSGNVLLDVKNQGIKLKNKKLLNNLKIKSQDLIFEFNSKISPKGLKFTDSKFDLSGNIAMKYGQNSYKIDDINLAGLINIPKRSMKFESSSLTINGREIETEIDANMDSISLNFNISKDNYQNTIALLPPNFIPKTREWLDKSIKNGSASVEGNIQYVVPDGKLNYKISIPFEDADLKFHSKMPMLEAASGQVMVELGNVKIDVANSKIMNIGEISGSASIKFQQDDIIVDISDTNSDFDSEDSDVDGAPSANEGLSKAENDETDSDIKSDMISNLEDNLGAGGFEGSAILTIDATSKSDKLQDALSLIPAFTNTELPSIDAKGEANTKVNIQLPLGTKENVEEMLNLRVESEVTFSEFDEVYSKGLSDLLVKLVFENGNIEAKGNVIYDNSIPLELRYNKSLGKNFKFDPADIQVAYNNDINKLSGLFDVPQFLSGNLNAAIQLEGDNQIEINSNLVGLKIDSPALFLEKNADSSGTLSMNVKRDGSVLKIFDIAFETPPISVSGNIDVNGKNIAGKIFYKHSEIGNLGISLNGDSFNISGKRLNFTNQNVFNMMLNRGASKSTNYTGLIESIALKNEIELSQLKISNQFCPDCKLELSAKIAHNGRDFQLMNRGKSILINSDDAGSVLKGLDIFKKMEMGVLQVKLDDNGSNEIAGNITIDDFIVVQNNFFVKLFALPSLTVSPQTVKELVEGGYLKFKTLVCPISIGNSQINFRKCVAKSDAINIKISGVIDLHSKTIRMDGLFVPKNIVNSIVKEIPIIGKVLSGGSNEGIIATTFKIEGSLDDPQIVINPLSTLTPGFTREILNVFN